MLLQDKGLQFATICMWKRTMTLMLLFLVDEDCDAGPFGMLRPRFTVSADIDPIRLIQIRFCMFRTDSD